MSKGLKTLSLVTTIMMLAVIFGGALVTQTESGEGCGRSWPLCEGLWTPLPTTESLIEYSHRAVSGVTGVLVLILFIWAWVKGKGRWGIRGLALSTFVFTFLQAWLGAAAVMWPQHPLVMAVHFGVSQIAFVSVFLLTMLMFENGSASLAREPVSAGFRQLVWAVTAFTFIVVYLGAYVVHTRSSGGCGKSWPLCHGALIPDFHAMAVVINYVHRVTSGLLFLFILWLLIVAVKRYAQRKDILWGSVLSFIWMTLLVFSGAWLIFSELTLSSTLTHVVLITLLFANLCYLCMQTIRKPA